ncbi:NIPSNAP family protein [Sphingobium sp.]|uniref:NIPSNAP family protein n=1 Tax=Sphingobium sp. TaxID=1912891 RepID=UPI00391CA8BA
MEPGDHGPYYEIRTYRMKPVGLARLMPEWAEIAPQRSPFSPLLTAAYAIDVPTRMIHIWPYARLEARADARADAARNCEGWPTPSGFDWIDADSMSNAIFVPYPGSPLHQLAPHAKARCVGPWHRLSLSAYSGLKVTAMSLLPTGSRRYAP